ncbi:MAG TPA: hypothetical protein VHB54_15885 [Mucilaginibacter sp.]|nr:hypothetical protein [Mucilaginibacter sp.]HVW15312.1 hypothetical protein [Mucilaginibacter sp.]
MNTNSTEEANAERHYLFLILAVVVSVVGLYFRFIGDQANYTHISAMYTHISDIILVTGAGLCLRFIYDILK